MPESSFVDSQDSLLSFLEQSVAHLEAEVHNATSNVPQLSSHQIEGHSRKESLPDFPPSATEPADSSAYHDQVSHFAKTAMEPASNSVFQSSTSVFYEDHLVVDSDLPAPSSPNVDWKSKKALFSSTPTGLDAIPFSVANALFDVYVDKILLQYPIFHPGDLREIFHAAYHDQGLSAQHTQHDVFIVLMILAISTMTSSSPDYKKPASLAESLHQNALRHTEILSTTSIRSLQCILLLIQLGYLLPHTGSLVHLVSEAMRMAVELGLHTESVEALCLDRVEANFRRALFWLVYAMERSVDTSCRRHFLLRDEHINVLLPAEYEEEWPQHLDNASAKKLSRVQFINSVRYRQFQSEIFMVQFYNTRLPSTAYAEWVAETQREVFNWRLHALSSSEAPPDWFDFGTWYILLILHRPCPGNPSPPLSSVKYCITAAAHIAAGYWHTARHGFLKFPWHGVHNCFEAGTILLYNLVAHADVFRSECYIEYQQTLDILNQLSDVFLVLSQRWPTARQSMELFDSLRAEVLESHSGGSSECRSSNDIFETLRNIVFQKGTPIHTREPLNEIHTAPEMAMDPKEALAQPQDDLATWLQWSTDMLVTSIDFGYLDLAYMVGPGTPPNPFGEEYVPQLSLPPKMPSPLLGSSDSSDESALRYVQDAFLHLPSCSNCRYRRIKCDRAFPSCGHCSKMHKDCRFSDPVLSQDVSRPYLHTLRTNFETLIAKKQSAQTHYGSTLNQTLIESKHKPATPTTTYCVTCTDTMSDGSTELLFFGPSSVFSHLIQTLLALQRPLLSHVNLPRGRSIECGLLHRELTIETPRSLDPSFAEDLMAVFYHSVKGLYHMMGGDTMHAAIETACTRQEMTARDPKSLMYCLMVAISTRIISKRDARFDLISCAFFQAATRNSEVFDRVAEQPNVCGLQVTALLCFYLLLDPLAGNVWRVLGHACRTCMDLSFDSTGSSTTQKVDWRLYSALFRLECDVAIAYGRPAQLPELEVDSQLLASYDVDHGQDWTAYLLYKLTLINHSVHGRMLCQKISSTDSEPFFVACRQNLENWGSSWTLHISDLEHFSLDLAPWLQLCGKLYYSQAGLLLHRASNGAAFLSDETRALAVTFINSLLDLFIHGDCFAASPFSDQTPPPMQRLYFPVFWTTAHTLFSAGLVLVDPSLVSSKEVDSCIWLLTCLEADKGNLCSEFADEVRRLHQQQQHHQTAQSLLSVAGLPPQ